MHSAYETHFKVGDIVLLDYEAMYDPECEYEYNYDDVFTIVDIRNFNQHSKEKIAILNKSTIKGTHINMINPNCLKYAIGEMRKKKIENLKKDL